MGLLTLIGLPLLLYLLPVGGRPFIARTVPAVSFAVAPDLMLRTNVPPSSGRP